MRRGRSAAGLGAHRLVDVGRRRIAGEGVVGTVEPEEEDIGRSSAEEDTAAVAEGSWHSLAGEGPDCSHSLAAVGERPIDLEERRGDLRGRGLVLDTCRG